MSLIVTGSIGIDCVETPTGQVDNVLGGAGSYFAAAARFFGPVRLVAAVGEDFPDELDGQLKSLGVDLEGLEKRVGSKTFRWSGKYHENMNRRDTTAVELNVLIEALPPVPESYRDSEFIFLAVTSPQNQLELLETFPKRKLVMADTIELYLQTERDAFMEVVQRVDGLVINDDEAMMFTGETDAVKAAEAMLAMGLKFVVVKKGEHGVLLRHQDGWAALPAFPQAKLVDPTGAGDTFAGGMMAHLAATGDMSLNTLKQALAYGTVVASYTIEAFSLDRLTSITRDDIDGRYRQYREMLAIE